MVVNTVVWTDIYSLPGYCHKREVACKRRCGQEQWITQLQVAFRQDAGNLTRRGNRARIRPTRSGIPLVVPFSFPISSSGLKPRVDQGGLEGMDRRGRGRPKRKKEKPAETPLSKW
jgi:hypothetical protein